jgi:hypothetical protein
MAGGRPIVSVLAVMWLWTGIACHILHFEQINVAAWGVRGVVSARRREC